MGRHLATGTGSLARICAAAIRMGTVALIRAQEDQAWHAGP